MLPTAYNNNIRIVQAAGYVMILVEMIHDIRVIPLDDRPHLPQNVSPERPRHTSASQIARERI